MIIENIGNPSVERGGTHIGARPAKFRGKSDPRSEAPTPPATWIETVLASETGRVPAGSKKADCGELFRSWAFPKN